MEEFVIVANQTLAAEEKVIYSNNKGVVIKTILLSSSTQTEAILTFDGVSFPFSVQKETTVMTMPILTKEIKASGNNVKLHITGLQL